MSETTSPAEAPQSEEKQRSLSRVFLILTIISFAVFCFLLYFFEKSKIEAERKAKKASINDTRLIAGKIQKKLSLIENEVKALASDPRLMGLDDEALRKRLEGILSGHPRVFRAGIAYGPFAKSEAQRLYAPHSSRERGGGKFYDGGALEDYTTMEWFQNPYIHGAQWSVPYLDKVTNSMMIDYACPLPKTADGGSPGVIRVSLPADGLNDLISSSMTGNVAYMFLINQKGIFVYAPVPELVTKRISIFDFARETKQPEVAEASRLALNNERFQFQGFDKDIRQVVWIFFESVPSAGWRLGSVFMSHQFSINETTRRRLSILMALAAASFLFFLSMLLLRAYRFETASLWGGSIIFSLLCIAATCYIWSIELNLSPYHNDRTRIITNNLGLYSFLNEYREFSRETRRTAPIFIPTGLSIQSLEFKGANNVAITGYLWQKYRKGDQDGLARGFTFPEAQTLKIQEAYRDSSNDIETVGWQFEAEVREYFDYMKYPFDRPDIWLWIRHREHYRNVIAVPDIASYNFLSPFLLPGIQEGLVLPGYTHLVSYFEMTPVSSTTNLGIVSNSPGVVYPELYYHLIEKRNFATPFVSKIFPLLIMLSMLFVVQLTFTTEEERRKSFGLSGLGVVGTAITFFFSTILSQSNLRSELAVTGITFIENFYFITYFVLLEVVIIAFLFTGKSESRFIHYEHCLIPKLLYWPSIMFLVLLISLVSFF
ncbi:MAG: cache domain-containing protein [Candidatus Eremiobacteraeota bacterium]|nr:cache domain-containing protein [Candidatus Eremiobacteraeota bacterium]